MHEGASALPTLLRCLRGRPPRHVDWMSVIALANRSLTIAALAVALEDAGDAIPDDVIAYLRMILERNVERNSRLAAQLSEAVNSLHQCGLDPLLLKGAVVLALGTEKRIAGRMLSDLDLMLAPADVPRAVACLQRLGYQVMFEARHPGPLLAARLSRRQDAGVIDLHQRLLLQSKLVRPDLDRHCRVAASRLGKVTIPSPTLQLLILVLHDQLHDGDYWTGRIELRHLLDMASLTSAPEGIDWDLLVSLLPGKLAKNALETQLVTMHKLVDGPVPSRMRSRLWPRLQHQRRMLQIRYPFTRVPFCLATVAMEAKNYTAHSALAASARAPDPSPRPARSLPIGQRMQRLRHLMTVEATSKL